MRTVAKIFRILMWIAFGFAVIMQGMSIVAIDLINNQQAIELGKLEYVYNTLPMILSTLVLTGGVILFVVLKKRRYIGFILAAAAAVAFVVIGLDIGRVFAVQIGAAGQDVGLDTWEVIYRHMSPVLVAIFMLPAWICGRIAEKEKEAAASVTPAAFDLGDEVLFHDAGEKVPSTEKPSLFRHKRKKGDS